MKKKYKPIDDMSKHTHKYTNGESFFSGTLDDCEAMRSRHQRRGYTVELLTEEEKKQIILDFDRTRQKQ